MPDVLLDFIIGIIVFIIIMVLVASEDPKAFLLSVIPFGLAMWLAFAANLEWETKTLPCSVSEIILPNGGKSSVVTYMNNQRVVTKTLEYYLDSSKSYVIDIPNRDRTYAGIYFVGNNGIDKINVRPVSPEVDNK